MRVLYYRQHKPNGNVIQPYRLTNLSAQRVSTRSLFRMAKSRWEIEKQGFNEAKNQHGMEHIPRHHASSVLLAWLLNALFENLTRRGTALREFPWSKMPPLFISETSTA